MLPGVRDLQEVTANLTDHLQPQSRLRGWEMQSVQWKNTLCLKSQRDHKFDPRVCLPLAEEAAKVPVLLICTPKLMPVTKSLWNSAWRSQVRILCDRGDATGQNVKGSWMPTESQQTTHRIGKRDAIYRVLYQKQLFEELLRQSKGTSVTFLPHLLFSFGKPKSSA